MPQAVKGNDGRIHVVFGSGDSILYNSLRSDENNEPQLIAVLPGLAASHMRGPQIAATAHGITVIACNKQGDIFSYLKNGSGEWKPGGKVNDADTVAKEGLMSLAGDGELVFAVWLDLRSKNNQLYGSRSSNGGQSWGRNMLIYSSPDNTVCECCKPSVAMKDTRVAVQFRNWLNGDRDLYLIQSDDAGTSFGTAVKLGTGSWKLDGCPMDGGSLSLNAAAIQTVWRRKGIIYTCEPGGNELELAEGKNPVLQTLNGENVYAWTEGVNIMVQLPKQEKKNIGKGTAPVLVADAGTIYCIYEANKKILKTTIAIK